MAHLPGRTPFGDKKSSSSLTFEEFVPPSAWTEDSTHHYLLVDLPGFKRQELKLQADSQTHIVVSGERQVRENRYKRFEQSFELPKNADVDKITGKLDGEILYITVPKKVEQQHQEVKHEEEIEQEPSVLSVPVPVPESESQPESESEPEPVSDEDDEDKKSDAYKNEEEIDKKDSEKGFGKKNRRVYDENWREEADLYLRVAIEKLRKNKGIVVTAIFAFSLGVLVSQKFQSNGQ
ncbi:hypothetical protein L2E82_16885 [Cichorium intybus]|uniref:Uncharacterized protein n=1 Tax=Cichorium intybus TaxID=13427 RepID=A0ACB9F814_CICIN|nr:hypothetical protein L2E82_16885 [Cichorium intybus]